MLNIPSASTLAAASKDSSRNDSSSAKKAADEVDETPKTLSRIHRASSSGKDAEANFTSAAKKCEEVASPRYKFDIETRKFVIAKDRSPVHRVV